MLPLGIDEGVGEHRVTATAVISTDGTAGPSRTRFARIGDGHRLRLNGWAARRPRLVLPLCEPDSPPLAVLVAPAGYGKTTLLEEWAERDLRPFAWIALCERDNEPGRLEAALSSAVERVSGRAAAPMVLVLDNLHALRRPAALAVLSAAIDGLPREVTLALASRTEPPLPLARLRAERRITELRPRDLAMTRAEASGVFRRAGLHLDPSAVELLVGRTEGWPAGLSLAALSLGDQRSADGAVARFGGTDRLVGGYLRDEVLSTLAPHLREFLLRTSVLETLTGPLCDAVLDCSGSARMLSELAHSNVLMVSMDRTDERYRYHRLLAQMLRAELRRWQPDIEPELHRRASEWFRRAGDVDRSMQHALCAGEVGHAGELVCGGTGSAMARGRTAVVARWLERFTDPQIAVRPRLAVVAAATALARGDGHLAEHWLVAAAAPGKDIDGAVSGLRAALGRDGVPAMRADASRSYELAAGDSPWRSLACLISGTADVLTGNRARGVRQLEEGAHRAAIIAPHLQALCLSQLAVLEAMDDESEDAAALVTRARSQVDRYSLGADPISALVFATSAVVRAHRGRLEEARNDLHEAMRLAEKLIDFPPWYAGELHILMARAALRLGDPAGARNLLAHAGRHVARAPAATVLAQWHESGRTQCAAFAERSSAETTSLTAAELRILGYLPTHLSFREIAERTYVSANTVKTQANAVYRKLDVSCRSEAVAHAREIGLIDTAPLAHDAETRKDWAHADV
jgi:LuxR family transcriptional regulator, maltose regulon positive regulatory protein